MRHISGGLSFPRQRTCVCCFAPFLAQQIHDLHCSSPCLQQWQERLQVLQQLPTLQRKRRQEQFASRPS